MLPADEFDEFYKSTRTQLLQQTFALTGDLPASRAAVRDAYVAAWHHWRKVSRLDDPVAWIRPLAWRHSLRRHSARIFHRDRGLDPGVAATLDALAKLPLVQRKVLLLTQLTDASRIDIAREVGLPLHEAEQRLQLATSQFALHREVPTTAIRTLLEPLREHVADVRWPRVTIVRRAGTTRRRTHTAIGAVAVVGALVLGGAVVTDAQGVKPSLESARANGVAALQLGADPSPASPSDEAGTDQDPGVVIEDDDLVTLEQVSDRLPGRWREVDATGDRTGILLPCQAARFADPQGTASAVRRFKTPATKAAPRRSVVQSVELSADAASARASYAAMLGWFGGCAEERAQLITTQDVDAVGDEATLLVLRSWQRPESTWVAGVARTGTASTITFTKAKGTARPELDRAAGLLADAVNGLCALPRTGACAEKPVVTERRPVPTGEVPAMLSEVDLSPVAEVDQPWIGTEVRVANANLAASRCDNTSFAGKPMQRNMTRSFVIPEANLSDLFGLTESVGRLPEKQARAFVTDVRSKLRACPDKQLGTDVVRVADISSAHEDLTVWHVTTEISDNASVTYLMGIVRDGRNVAQVAFVPDGKVQMAPGAFVALVHRALDRLPALRQG